MVVIPVLLSHFCGNSNSSGTNRIFIGNDVDDVYIAGGRLVVTHP